MKMTVYFDGVFWSALVEFIDRKGHYKAFRHVFGPEPKDNEVVEFIHFSLEKKLNKYENVDILDNSAVTDFSKKRTNPKRIQRELNKAKKQPILSTKAQISMQEIHESFKRESRELNKEFQESKRRLKYQQKREKRHQKKRGH